MNRSSFLTYLGFAGLALPKIPGILTTETFRQTKIIKPPRLKKGDTIGLISPASIIPEREQYDKIAETIRLLGFNVEVGRHALNRNGYLAGSDEQRAADLNAMFENPLIDAIIPFRGGWGSNRMLQYVDFNIIKANPKPLIGFSDITSLLLSIYARTGLITFHGPVGKSEWTSFTYRHFEKAVMTLSPFTVHNPTDQQTMTIQSGKASGPLIGGNLTVLTSMLGSGYLPDFEGAILFLEDVGEDVYRIDRMLTQLKLNGILDKINGLIFGKCTDCRPGNSYSFSLAEVLNDHLLPLDIPSCRGAMIGHIDNMFTLPVGLPVSFLADRGVLTFSKPAVL